MNGPVTVRTSNQLRNIESTLFELLDEGVDIHIIPSEHRCPSDETYDLIRKNECNIRKIIFASRKMINEFIILDAVLQNENYVGLRYNCPGCDYIPTYCNT